MRVDDSTLLRMSLGVSSFGLVLLFLVSTQSQPTLVRISEIDYDDVGSELSVEGRIASKRVHADGHIFLKVEDATGRISVVLFSEIVESLTEELGCLEEGEEISITGRIEEYRGLLEIVPKKGLEVSCSPT